VAELLDMPENRVKQRLYQMSKDGEVKVVSRGRYELHNLHNFHNQEEAKVTEVMEVMGSHNETSSPVTCIHGSPGGKDCYLCDPDHPHRKEERP
jgi:hypothetical protein